MKVQHGLKEKYQTFKLMSRSLVPLQQLKLPLLQKLIKRLMMNLLVSMVSKLLVTIVVLLIVIVVLLEIPTNVLSVQFLSSHYVVMPVPHLLIFQILLTLAFLQIGKIKMVALWMLQLVMEIQLLVVLDKLHKDSWKEP